MSDVEKRQDKINDFEAADGRPTSESLLHKISGDINFLIDETEDQEDILSSINAKKAVAGTRVTTNIVGSSFQSVCSVTLTPTQSNILLMFNGYLATEQSQIARILRNGSTIYNSTISSLGFKNGQWVPLSYMNYLDINATATLPTTYTLQMRNASINFDEVSIIALEV